MARATRSGPMATAPRRRAVEGDATEGAVHLDDGPRSGSHDSRRAVLRTRSRQHAGDERRGARSAQPWQDDPLLHAHHGAGREAVRRSEEHTSELQSRVDLVCRLLLEKKKKKIKTILFTKKRKKNIK